MLRDTEGLLVSSKGLSGSEGSQKLLQGKLEEKGREEEREEMKEKGREESWGGEGGGGLYVRFSSCSFVGSFDT